MWDRTWGSVPPVAGQLVDAGGGSSTIAAKGGVSLVNQAFGRLATVRVKKRARKINGGETLGEKSVSVLVVTNDNKSPTKVISRKRNSVREKTRTGRLRG